MLVAYCRLCGHCCSLAEGGCLLSQFHFTRCHYFLGNVACQNLPPYENFREPFGLPNILVKVPRPQSWSPKYIWWRSVLYAHSFYCLLITELSNSSFWVRQNPYVVLWNPLKFSCHSDLYQETWAMLLNCSGFKEGEVKISADLRNFH